MNPLSAVVCAITFIIFGLSLGTWLTISPKLMGAFFIITAIVVLIDTFWLRSAARWDAHRTHA
jgi:hypothetical protein